MGEVSTIGVDIAKSVFQVHGVDADGTVVIRRRVGRAQMLEFFSNCGRALLAWRRVPRRTIGRASSRSLAMTRGSCRRPMSRPTSSAIRTTRLMRRRSARRYTAIACVSYGSRAVEQQGTLMLHRTRDVLIRQRTQMINAFRAHLAELGLVAAKGREGLCAVRS